MSGNKYEYFDAFDSINRVAVEPAIGGKVLLNLTVEEGDILFYLSGEDANNLANNIKTVLMENLIKGNTDD